MYIVYVIENEKGKVYTGYTENIEKRLDRHNKKLSSKSSSFTAKNSGIWKLIYSEEFPSRTLAVEREKQLKSYQGRQYIKKIMGW